MAGFAMKPIDQWLRSLSEIPPKTAPNQTARAGKRALHPAEDAGFAAAWKSTDRAPADRNHSYQGVPTKTTAGLAVMREKPNRAHYRGLGHAHCRDAPHWKNLSPV